MKFFDKKILFILFFLIIIICALIYFFTIQNSYDDFSLNEFYVQQNSVEDTNITKYIVIHVDGEVINPGIVKLQDGARISDAILAAGGTTPLANIKKVNLAYMLKDGQKVYIPSVHDEENDYIQNEAGNNVIVVDSSSDSALININSASQAELESLPRDRTCNCSKNY